MTTIQLARLVREMRQAQQRYHKFRRPEDLEDAKGRETRVDDAVRLILEQHPAMLPGME